MISGGASSPPAFPEHETDDGIFIMQVNARLGPSRLTVPHLITFCLALVSTLDIGNIIICWAIVLPDIVLFSMACPYVFDIHS